MVGATPHRFTATRQKTTHTTVRPTIFCEGVRPSERLCATDSMSSRRPRAPVASIAKSARKSMGDQGAMRSVVTTTPRSITMPPMVGVPCFTR